MREEAKPRPSLFEGPEGLPEEGERQPADQIASPHHICPYLGSQIDPATAFAYPAPANHCHHVLPATEVQLEHQRFHCLTARHTACPIYRQPAQIALPRRRTIMPPSISRPALPHVTWPRLGRPAVNPLPPLRRLLSSARPLAPSVLRFAAPLAVVAFLLVLFLIGWRNREALAAWLPDRREPATAQPADPLVAAVSPAVTNVRVTATTRPPQATPTSAPAGCAYPAGWLPVRLSSAWDIDVLARGYGLVGVELAEANCLAAGAALVAGQILYVPDRRPSVTPGPELEPATTRMASPTPEPSPSPSPSPTASPTVEPTPTPLPSPTAAPTLPATAVAMSCQVPAGWVRYTVLRGETLYEISLKFRVSVVRLQEANCLTNADFVWYGQRLWVPNTAPINPGPPPAPQPTAVPTTAPPTAEPPPPPPPQPQPTDPPPPPPPPTATAPMPTEAPPPTPTAPLP
jgi:hypothetical protein